MSTADARAPNPFPGRANRAEAVHLTGGDRTTATLEPERHGAVVGMVRRRHGIGVRIGREDVVDEVHRGLETLFHS
jgi:hypothetical protein